MLVSVLLAEYDRRKKNGEPFDFEQVLGTLNAEADRIDGISHLAESASHFTANGRFKEYVDRFLALGGAGAGALNPGAAVATSIAKELIGLAGMTYEDLLGDEAQMIAQLQSLDVTRYLRDRAATDLQRLLDVAASDPAVAAVFDTRLSSVLGVSHDATREQLLAANLGLATHTLVGENSAALAEIRALLERYGESQAAGDAEMRELLGKLFEVAKSTNAAAATALAQIAAGNGVQLDEATRRRLAEQHAAAMAEMQAAGFIATTFLRFLDAELADKAGRLFAGFLAINDALAKFALRPPGMGGELSLVAAFLDVGLDLVAMFSDPVVPIEQVILDHLQRIEQQLDAIAEMMVEGFKVVNAKLDEILRVVARGFETVLRRLENQDRRLHDVQLLLSRQALAASRRHRETLAFLERIQASERRELINRCLTARRRHQLAENPLLFFSGDSFDLCLSTFRTWATLASEDPLGQDAPDGDPPPLTTADELANLATLTSIADAVDDPLKRLDLLARTSAAFGNSRVAWLAGATLPDPYLWRLASSAYLRALADWPEYSRYPETDATDDLRAMIAAGRALRDTIQTFVLDEQGRASRVVFDAVVTAWRSALDHLLAALPIVEAEYRVEHGLEQDRSLLDLWGEPGQPAPFAPGAKRFRSAVGPPVLIETLPFLPLTEDVWNLIPPEYFTAERLGLGNLWLGYLGSLPAGNALSFIVSFSAKELENGDPIEYPSDERTKHSFSVFHRHIAAPAWSFNTLQQKWPTYERALVNDFTPGEGEFCLGPIFPGQVGRSKEECIEREKAAPAKHLARMRTLLAETLTAHRLALRGVYAAKLELAELPTQLDDMCRRADALRVLVQSYASLIWSSAIETDDGLHGNLYGIHGLPSADDIIALVRSMFELDPQADLNAIRASAKSLLDAAVTALDAKVDEFFARPMPAEPCRVIERTLQTLEALYALRVQEIESHGD